MPTIHHGDCIQVMNAMPAESVDAIVTDPPYGLGFMGRKWDSLPPSLEWAEACMRVLKPGGHIVAFGGTRTWHRLAVAIEDAGFEMRDSLAWLYGSGFPKSHDVSKAIDKRGGVVADFTEFRDACRAAMAEHGVRSKDLSEALGNHMLSHYLTRGSQPAVPTLRDYRILRDALSLGARFDALFQAEAEREVVGQRTTGIGTGRGAVAYISDSDNRDLTAAHTPEAQQWDGWGTALKPAFEPIVLARKPFPGTVAANVLEHGTGAINVDACRIGTDDNLNGGSGHGILRLGGCHTLDELKVLAAAGEKTPNGETATLVLARAETAKERMGEFVQPSGRWPANVLLDQHAAAWVDEQSGITKSNVRTPTGKDDRGKPNTDSSMTVRRNDTTTRGVSDQGGASRFFTTIERSNTPCAATSENATTTTATTAPGAKPAPSGLASPAQTADANGELTDAFLYTAKAPRRERPNVDGVQHPTVKPLAIMQWLLRLVTPPGGTVLDPFAGSGTTIEAAIIEGFNPVGIEMEADYLPLIQHRIDRQAGTLTA